jgi:hypothetical protein
MEFDESEHPRDGDGKFTSGNKATYKELADKHFDKPKSKDIRVYNPTITKRLTREEINYNGAETTKEYLNSTNNGILEYIDKVKNGHKDNLPISKPTKDEVKEIKKIAGVDTTGWNRYITPDTIRHIAKRHGENGNADKSMKDPKDIARIDYALNNFDKIVKLDKKSQTYKNADNTPADIMLYQKRINGYYFVSEAVADSKNKRLVIESAYKNEKPQVSDA